MRFFKTIHFLSLDVVIGACLFQCLLTSIFLDHQIPPPAVTISLAIVVWTVYLLDRLIDIQKPVIKSPIHDFHLRYTLYIKWIIGFNLIFLFFLIKYLPNYLIKGGVAIGFIILIYWVLLILRFFERIKYVKELATACIYTAGISLYIAMNIKEFSFLSFALLVILFFLLVFQNLILFTLISAGESSENNLLCYFEISIMAYWIFVLIFTQIAIIFLIPFLLTFVIHLWIHYISTSKRFAWLGELAFFSPLFYYLYAIIST